VIIEPDPSAARLLEPLGCLLTSKPTELVCHSQVIILAVKPQQALIVFEQLAGHLHTGQLIVSVMAGIRVATIQTALHHPAVVRVMPNTPAQVGQGMSVYFVSSGISAHQLDPVMKLLESSGEALAVASEDLIDAATAVSGSGPAYVFFLCEHWMRAAQELGFSEGDASRLVQQTLRGAAALLQTQGVAPSVLREQVTSKGGTTAAALERFRLGKTGESIADGIRCAWARARQLSL